MKVPVSLVLSSGGARGLAQIGVIEVLEENGFNIQSVAGASMGAVVGGLFAMGKLSDYKDWIVSLKRKDVFGLLDFTISGSGLVKAERIFQKMKEFIPDMLIEDMAIPYAAVATDVIGRQELVFRSGSFYEAVRASIAIPAVITPVKKGKMIMVDGGVMNPVPYQHVMRTKGDRLVVVNLYGGALSDQNSEEKEIVRKINRKTEPGILDRFHNSENYQQIKQWISEFISAGDHTNTGYISLLNTVSSLMIIKMAEQSVQLSQADLVITIPQHSAGTWDFHKAADLIELGRRATQQALNDQLTVRTKQENPMTGNE